MEGKNYQIVWQKIPGSTIKVAKKKVNFIRQYGKNYQNGR